MSFRKCKEPCTRYITAGDTHDRCVVCLGLHHAQAALSGLSSCPHCDGLRLRVLRSRVEVFSNVALESNPRQVTSATAEAPHEARAWGDTCDMDFVDSAALEYSPHRSLSPTLLQNKTYTEPVVFSNEDLLPTPEACTAISFGCGRYDDDVLSTAASGSEDFATDTSPLPPSGQERRVSPSYSELLDVVSRAVGKLGLDWEVDKAEAQPSSKLDDRFLTSRTPTQPRRPLPFFPDLHQEVSRSWKQPFSARITNAAAADFATVSDMANHGYTMMPPVEETLAEHLAPSSAAAWKSRPLLPSKACRVTSSLVGKSYMAAGQAAASLHSMAVLQAYQAELLKELDEGEGITPEAVKELRRATDLALRATKHTARAVGRTMAGLISVERHLWLNLTDIKEKDKSFLMDAPVSRDGLFGEAVTSVVEKFRAAKQQSAAFRQLIPRRPREVERRQAPARSRSTSSHRQRAASREEPTPMAPPRKDWGPRVFPPAHQRQRKRLNLTSTAKASRSRVPNSSS